MEKSIKSILNISWVYIKTHLLYQLRLKYLILKLNCKDHIEYHLDQREYVVPGEPQKHNLKLAKMKYNRIVSQEPIYSFF